MKTSVVPDELCEHVGLGAEMYGGVVLMHISPPVSVGMCQPCIVDYKKRFPGSRKVSSASADELANLGIELQKES